MKILFTGCSHTAGAELMDRNSSRYSKLIADHYGIVEENVSKSGGSNYDLISNAMYKIEIDSSYDCCIVQLASENRVTLPYRDTLKSYFNKTKGREHEIINKTLLTLLSPTEDAFFKYNYPLIVMFDSFCQLRNIKPIFVFAKGRYLNWFLKNNNSNIDLLNYCFYDLVDEKDCGIGHILENGQVVIAKKLIEEIDKRLIV